MSGHRLVTQSPTGGLRRRRGDARRRPRRSAHESVSRHRRASRLSIGLHAWSITSITSINPRAADSVKNILQYRHINEGIVHTRTTEAGVRGGTSAPGPPVGGVGHIVPCARARQAAQTALQANFGAMAVCRMQLAKQCATWAACTRSYMVDVALRQ
jgi:hypothetical protein